MKGLPRFIFNCSVLVFFCFWATAPVVCQITNPNPDKEPPQGVKVPPAEWKKSSTVLGGAYFDGWKVGIGTKTPSAELDVRGVTNLSTLQTNEIRGTKQASLTLAAHDDIKNGAQINLYNNNDNAGYGRMDFNIGQTASGWGWVFSQYNGFGWDKKMVIRTDGKVEIGQVKNVKGDYRLYVEKGILTERVKLAINGSSKWADFVFEDDYPLLPLHEVETFIKTNKHLPNFPSEKEVKERGIDVAEMDALLLQKIEELTLYVIEQNKRIENLEKEKDRLKLFIKQDRERQADTVDGNRL